MARTIRLKTTTATAQAKDKAPVATATGPAITTIADKFSDIAPKIQAAVIDAQEAKALAAAYRLMGGKSVTTPEAATGNVGKFHKAALRKFATDAAFRAKALDAAAAKSPYSLAELVAMTRGLVSKSQVMHKSVTGTDGKTAVTGSAARNLYDAPDCFQFSAMARLDSMAFLPGKGLMTFITEQV